MIIQTKSYKILNNKELRVCTTAASQIAPRTGFQMLTWVIRRECAPFRGLPLALRFIYAPAPLTEAQIGRAHV